MVYFHSCEYDWRSKIKLFVFTKAHDCYATLPKLELRRVGNTTKQYTLTSKNNIMIINKLRLLLWSLPRFKGKQRLQLILDKQCGPLPCVVRGGGKLLLYPSSTQDAYFKSAGKENNSILWDQLLECQPESVFVDVGANVGYYSLQAARLFSAQGKVVSLEPSPREFSRLAWAKANNSHNSSWNILALAVGEPGHCRLIEEESHTGMNRLAVPGDHRESKEGTLTITAVKLDNLLSLFGIQSVDLLKVDTEGAEMIVLKSAEASLAAHRVKRVVVEITDKFLRHYGSSKIGLYEFMSSHGYRPTVGVETKEWQYDEVFSRPEE